MSRMVLPATGAKVFTAVVLAFGVSSASAAVISDSIFLDADWTHSILWAAPAVTMGPCQQILTGGNLNEYQQGHHTCTGSSSGLYDGHVFVGGGSYDPSSQGAIASLDVSYDYKDIAGPFTTQNGLLIRQGARTFLYFVDSAGPHPAWTSLAVSGITSTWNPAWVEVTGGVIINFTTPDFSASGLPMTFGYYTFNGNFTLDQTWGVDNFRVTTHGVTVPVAQTTWGAIKATYR